MNYYEKYLKYKQKYNNLKKQYGSGTELQKIKTPLFRAHVISMSQSSIGDITIANFKILRGRFTLLNEMFNNAELEKELNELSEEQSAELQKNENINKLKEIYIQIGEKFELPIINSGLKKLLNIVDVVEKKTCSVKEFMTLEEPSKICNNKTLVIGSCGDPAFFPNIHTINKDNDKIVEFFDLLTKANVDNKKVNIILGERSVEKDNINVTFDFDTSGKEIDLYIKELKCGISKSIYHLNCLFPLNADESNRLVLDKVLEMTKKFEVEIINKMCGTCHRSLYYLVQNGNDNLSYSVNPKQKINPLTDTEEIIKCFKK